MRAALYARVSTQAQGEEDKASIPEQVRSIEEYCEKQGYEVADRYVDIGYSGAKSKRPEFQRMLNDAKQRKFNVIVAWKADRLSRGMYPASALMEVIEPLDIKLEAVEEHLDMNYFAMLAVVGKMELDNIKARCLMGKKAGAKAGKLSFGGTSLYGYDHIDKKRIVNETQAEIVRAIFDKVVNKGYTLYKVAKELNREGIEAPKGGKWSIYAISRLVRNPAYRGEAYAFCHKVIEPQKPRKEIRHYSKTTHILRNREEWIPLPNTPAILSPEMFEAAQKQLELNKKKSYRNRKHEYLLINGRFRCGICGHSMCGTHKKTAKGDWLFYRCITNMKPECYDICSQPSISANKVEPQVWEEVKKVLKNPNLILKELERQRQQDEPVALQAEEILAENSIKKLIEEEKRYLRKYGQGIIDDNDLDREVLRVRELRTQEEAKLTELKRQRKQVEEADICHQKVSDVIDRIAENVDNADYELKQRALEAFKVEVILQPNRTILIKGVLPTELQQTSTTSQCCR